MLSSIEESEEILSVFVILITQYLLDVLYGLVLLEIVLTFTISSILILICLILNLSTNTIKIRIVIIDLVSLPNSHYWYGRLKSKLTLRLYTMVQLSCRANVAHRCSSCLLVEAKQFGDVSNLR